MAHPNLMRRTADWWTTTIWLLPTVPDVDFPARRLALALGAVAGAATHLAAYPEALELLDGARDIASGPEDMNAFHTFIRLYIEGCLRSDPALDLQQAVANRASLDEMSNRLEQVRTL